MAGIDEASASPRINQYETGKHAPDLVTAERLAKVLEVPAAFFYARDDSLATWILCYEVVTPTTRKKIQRELEGALGRKSTTGQRG